jgi:ribonucleoside-diphosphate reductase alpha chain
MTQQSNNNSTKSSGLKIKRQFTDSDKSPFDHFKYESRSSVIRNPSGDEVFRMDDVEVPSGWSQVATDILAQKYFRKTGVKGKDVEGGSENSIKQVVHRLADCWKDWGMQHGYFKTETDAKSFYDEIVFMLLAQMAAPNSTQWFNT